MDIIQLLQEKYHASPYMQQKLNQYIQQLPSMMSSLEQEYKQKCLRKEQLQKAKDTFLTSFMAEHLYYYIPQTELYLEYNQEHYTIISEDDIAHEIMQNIRNYKLLMHWKFKIMVQLFKRIKDQSIASVLPSFYTETNVMYTLTPYFKTPTHLKYLLCLLGEALINKKETLTHFMDISYKPLLQAMSQQVYTITNKTFDIIKYKYYDHKYDKCRVITGTCLPSIPKWKILDIIMLGVRYASLHQSTDGFLEQCDEPFISSVMLLTYYTPAGLIQYFLQEYTMESEQSLSFKDIYFLWRTFLRNHSLPFVISQPNVKSLLTDLHVYHTITDMCPKITSKYNPSWIQFKHFWDKYMLPTEDDDHIYDLHEILHLYHLKTDKQYHITEQVMQDILSFEYPHVIISPHIFNMVCTLWNKPNDIDAAMTAYRYQEDSKDLDKMYTFYTQYKKNELMVSYSYFQRYLQP
jgi:hypothetical protein